jgi:hypothetical protein
MDREALLAFPAPGYGPAHEENEERCRQSISRDECGKADITDRFSDKASALPCLGAHEAVRYAAAITPISTMYCGSASFDSTQARAGVSPCGTQASQISLTSLYEV